MSKGTITLNNKSATVTGSSTSFSSDLTSGDFIVSVVGGVTYTLPVKTVDSDSQVTLIKAYDGPSSSGAAWNAVPKDTMTAITAQLASQVTYAIRGLNLDKTNWQRILTESGDVTVTLPDNTTYTGPAWRGVAGQLSSINVSLAAVDSAKMAKSSNLSDLTDKSAARSNLGVNYTRSSVNAGGGVYRLFSTEDSGLMIITRRFYVTAAASSSTGWSYNWVSDGSSSFSGYPGISVTGQAGGSSDWKVGVESLTASKVSGFIHNTGGAQNVWLTITAIGMRA